MKKIISVFILVLVCYTANCQDKVLKTAAETKQLSDDISKEFYKKNYSEAYKIMGDYCPLPLNELYSIEQQTIKQLNVIDERFGKILGYSYVSEKKVGDFIINYIYVVKYERHIIRISFIYYKNNSGWILNSLVWDDNIQKLLE